MRSVLIIGLGRFGKHLAKRFYELGNEVMIVDDNEDNIREMMPYACNAKIADCTRPEAVESLGPGNFDICFVCMGSDFQSSLEITDLLKEMGARRVVSKASSEIHAKFLARNGADKVVYPESDQAEKIAEMYSTSDYIFDVTKVTEDTGIYEIPILDHWEGKDLLELNIRGKHKMNILAIKQTDSGGTNIIPLPDPKHKFEKDDHIIVFGRAADVNKFLRRIDD
ncbi:MAG: TrkA family potassium uptake protein [Ruminococcus sp.]|nr:TrkA family potassium uptake protein [Ruminococcus sp.]